MPFFLWKVSTNRNKNIFSVNRSKGCKHKPDVNPHFTTIPFSLRALVGLLLWRCFCSTRRHVKWMKVCIEWRWTRLKSQVLSKKSEFQNVTTLSLCKTTFKCSIAVTCNIAQSLHGQYPRHLWGTGYLGEARHQLQPRAGILLELSHLSSKKGGWRKLDRLLTSPKSEWKAAREQRVEAREEEAREDCGAAGSHRQAHGGPATEGSDPTSPAQACRDCSGAVYRGSSGWTWSFTSQEQACLHTASFTMKVLLKK